MLMTYLPWSQAHRGPRVLVSMWCVGVAPLIGLDEGRVLLLLEVAESRRYRRELVAVRAFDRLWWLDPAWKTPVTREERMVLELISE